MVRPVTTPDPALIDLHVHTTESDGSLSPRACVERAAELGLAAIAIVDHDTVAGNAEAVAAGEALGVEVVPGVEVSTEFDGAAVHILGYFVEEAGPELLAVLHGVRQWRGERNPQMLERLRELGCPIELHEVAAQAGGDVIGRPHMAAVMVQKGFVRSTRHAFDQYLADGAAADARPEKVDAGTAIEALVACGAVPILAHPGSMRLPSEDQLEEMVRALAARGLRGIEAIYSAHRDEQTADYMRLAANVGLLCTGGSDYHGASKPDIDMGCGFGNMVVPVSVLDALKEERRRLRA